ncbi:MAG: outer membrane beta-barrel protein [Rikenellaceae bacterium]
MEKRKINILSLIVVILLVLPYIASAQQYLGIRGGAGAGSIRLVPLEETQYNLATPLAGLTYRYYGGDVGVGGISVELNAQQKSFKVLPCVKSDSAYIREISQIEIPFFWQPHIELSKDKAWIYLNIGPYVAYNISSTERFVSSAGVLEDSDGNLWDYEYEFDSQRDNRFEYGIAAGVGFRMLLTKQFDLSFEMRYSLGYSDILKNVTKYSDNPTNSPLDFITASIGISYRLSK